MSEPKQAKYLNVSGRLLRDGEGEDWKPLKTAALDPDSHYARGLLAYGYIRPAASDTPTPGEAAAAATPPITTPTDKGAVATVLPKSADVPTDQQPAPEAPAPSKDGSK